VLTLEKVTLKLDPGLKGITALVYIPSPFVGTGTLEEAVSTLVINDADCSLGVNEIKDPLYKRSSHGLQVINPPRELSSDFDIVYRESNVALATRNANFRTGSLTGSKIVNFIVDSEECLFIDSQMSLEVARKIYHYKSGKAGLK
jgi:CMP-N-acetylneuraminic acid synthetase